MMLRITAVNNTRGAVQQAIGELKRLDAQANSVVQHMSRPVAANGAFGSNQTFRLQNLAYQTNDIVVGLSTGQRLQTVFMQQGAQIVQLYAGQGGVRAAFKDIGSLAESALGVVIRWAPALAAVGAAGAVAYGAFQILAANSAEAKLQVDDATRALADQAGPVSGLSSRIDELQRITDDYARAIRGTAKDQDIATNSIVANSEREFNAKKSLLELELKRQRAAIEVQKSEMEIASLQLKRQVSSSVLGGVDRVAEGYADPRIGQFVRSPDQAAALAKTQDLLANNPLSDKITELKANITIAESATSALEEALGTSFSDSVARSEGRIASTAKHAKTEAEKAAEKYSDLITRAKQHIAASELEAQTIGMTTEQIKAQTYAQDLMNKAINDNIVLTPKQRDELTALGAAMAHADVETQMLKDRFDKAKESLLDFGRSTGGVLRGLIDGTKSWRDVLLDVGQAFGKMLFQRANFGASTGGNFLQSLFSGLFGFADGGSGVVGGSGSYVPGGADDTLFVAKAKKGEPFAFGDTAVRGIANSNGGGTQEVTVHVTVGIDPDSGNLRVIAQQEAVRVAAPIAQVQRSMLRQANGARY